jgi:hypothetical protein
MAEALEIISFPSNTPSNFAGAINQFLRQNPAITINDMAVQSAQKDGQPKYRAIISYTTDGGGLYSAHQFTSNAQQTASQQLEAFFFDNPEIDLIKTFIVSLRNSRYANTMSLLALTIDKKYITRLWSPSITIAGIAAQDIAAGATDQFKQANDFNIDADRLEAVNLGNETMTSAGGFTLVRDLSGDTGGTGPAGVSGADDIGTLPPAIETIVCGEDPPVFPDPPDPPPQGNCCLSYDHECQCVDGVDTWVLKQVTCQNNVFCEPFLQFCNNNAAHFEQQGACNCQDPLPLIVPDPACNPVCCTTPPPPDDCCLRAQFDCSCETSGSGDSISAWSLTSIDCTANGNCTYEEFYYEEDTDGDGDADRITFEEQELCLCGTTDESTLLGLLPEPEFKDGAPTRTPECCDETPGTCCLQLSYECFLNSSNLPDWRFLEAECSSNDDCSSSGTVPEEPVTRFATEQTFLVTLRDGCNCDNVGAVTQEDAESVLPGYPDDTVQPSCDNGWEIVVDAPETVDDTSFDVVVQVYRLIPAGRQIASSLIGDTVTLTAQISGEDIIDTSTGTLANVGGVVQATISVSLPVDASDDGKTIIWVAKVT